MVIIKINIDENYENIDDIMKINTNRNWTNNNYYIFLIIYEIKKILYSKIYFCDIKYA